MDDFDTAKAAIANGDWDRARTLLEPLAAERPKGTPALFLARALLGLDRPDQAETVIAPFIERHPDHQGARVVSGEIHLARGDHDRARDILQSVLEIEPDKFRAQVIMKEIRNAQTDRAARARIAVIDAAPKDALRTDPAIRAAAEDLADLPLSDNWEKDPVQARIAFFKHAPSIDFALDHYDAHLIDVSVAFDYVTWPKRIQDHVLGKSVIDVGCGFGGYGMGFLVAGATEYAGLDPVMDLDSTRAKNKRTREWADMAVTPRAIADAMPAIRLFCGTSEDLSFDETFDTVALHNVTEHLIQLDLVFEGLVKLCKPETRIVFLHHNFYCWNGHHFSPNRPDQLDPDKAEHLQVADWNHITLAPSLPDDHYWNTHLNRVRLDEIQAITEKYFRIETWEEIPSRAATLERLTPEIIDRVRRTVPDITARDLKTNVVFCVARPKG